MSILRGLFLVALLVGSAAAAPELRVVIKPAEPFVFLDQAAPTGYSIELWQEVARAAGLRFTYQRVESIQEMIGALASGRADVAVGALSITSEREVVMDFSHGIYDAGLGLMVLKEKGGGQWLLELLKRSRILSVLALFSIAILLIGNVIWFLQRGHNHAHFPKTYLKGVGEAMWWSVSVLLTGCCEDKKVHGITARVLAVFWFLTGIIAVSFVTASLASSMTLSELSTRIHDLDDLKKGEIATVANSQAADFLGARNLTPRRFPDIGAAIDSLLKGEVHAVFYDTPMLQYQAGRRRGEGLVLLPVIYQPHQYGFGLQARSAYRKEINKAILEVEENGRMGELRRKWFGPGDTPK